MEMNQECFYCTKDMRLQELMIKITELDVSTLYLLKDQTYLGRCVIALNNHEKELFDLDVELRAKFINDVAKSALAIKDAYHADKINYAIYGDIVSHLHFHLVPKYMNAKNWGEPFENIPETKELKTAQEYEEIIDAIKRHL